jgi:hypothetical protein
MEGLVQLGANSYPDARREIRVSQPDKVKEVLFGLKIRNRPESLAARRAGCNSD